MDQKQIVTRSRYYESNSYRSLPRWCSYWHQIDLTRALAPASVLEVGIGQGVVADFLTGSGVDVKTIDIDASLEPDIVGDIREIPLPDNAVDVVIAAEILEHVPLEDARAALKEISRVAKKGAVISAPAPGWVFSLRFKLPKFTWEGITKIPFFWKAFQCDPNEIGVHHWELGYKGLPASLLESYIAEAGFEIRTKRCYQDDPSHLFYQLIKR